MAALEVHILRMSTNIYDKKKMMKCGIYNVYNVCIYVVDVDRVG